MPSRYISGRPEAMPSSKIGTDAGFSGAKGDGMLPSLIQRGATFDAEGSIQPARIDFHPGDDYFAHPGEPFGEAALGLGIPKWRTTISISLRTASAGIITGIMLAFARVAGETAPLLFTAFGNSFWNLNPNQPTAALPLQIFVYANSPYEEWHRLAWAGALILVVLIVAAVTAVRVVASRGVLKGSH